MNNLFKNIFNLFFISLLLVNCKKNDDDGNNFTPTTSTKDFVWRAMNSWYNWQESTPELADNTTDDLDTYNAYLDGFNSPQELFNSLKHEDDDFSWFIEDYVTQQQAFQGISTSFGINISPLLQIENTNNVIIYIEDISTGSPADLAGFKRGDIINGFNGTTMTVNNFNTVASAFFDDTTEFNFSENDGITFKESKTITRTVVEDNPVQLTKVFDDIDGSKVGYLVYNGFRSSYNDELNDAFGEFKNAGINELILDLRYNSGGSVLSSAFLASMIYDQADNDTTFASLNYNSKQSSNDSTFNFFDDLFVFDSDSNFIRNETINRLSGLNKIYILTSSGTASASEMIINGLRPFIEVKLIGDTTTGKNEGSITLYDSYTSDFTDVDSANPDHNMAMQPIVFQIFNSLGQSDYTFGFEPDIKVVESNYWNNILPFGDENEILLKTALDDIRGVSAKSLLIKNNVREIENNFSTNKFEKEMYIDGYFFK